MICPQCSTDVPDGGAFCPKCGQQLTSLPPKEITGPGDAAPQRPIAPNDRLRQGMAATRNNDPEVTLWTGGFAPQAMIGYWLLAGFVTLASVVMSIFLPMPPVWIAGLGISIALWAAFAGYFAYQRLSVEYTLTTQRLIHKSGLLRRKANRVEVIDIDDVNYEQGLVERMVGVGTIRILSSDVSDPTLTLPGIGDVARIANLIDDTRRDERRKRSMYIEAV
jgi:hypothetical protein